MDKLGFTENKDVNKEILLKMDDRNFIKTCNLNTYFQRICKEDDYLLFKRRLQLYYPDTLEDPRWRYMTWKEYYVSVIKTIAEIEENFEFKYKMGNPFYQLFILRSNGKNLLRLLLSAIAYKEISLIKYALKKGEKPRLPILINAARSDENIFQVLLPYARRKTLTEITMRDDVPEHSKHIVRQYLISKLKSRSHRAVI